MPKPEKQLLHKTLLKSGAVFIVSYLIFLPLWIQVQHNYSKGITFTASKIAAGVKDLRFEEMTEEGDMIQATFAPLGRGSSMLIDIPVKTSSFTFNAPLTFAIMAALYFSIGRRKMPFGQALLMLVAVHILYVFSLEAKELTEVLTDRGLEAASKLRLFCYQFLWSFTDNMIIRFEPFLIGFYIFIRCRE